MPIRVTPDTVLVDGKAADAVPDLNETQLSLFRSGKVRSIRSATLRGLT